MSPYRSLDMAFYLHEDEFVLMTLAWFNLFYLLTFLLFWLIKAYPLLDHVDIKWRKLFRIKRSFIRILIQNSSISLLRYTIIYIYKGERSPPGVVISRRQRVILISEFKIQPLCYVYFWTFEKEMKPLTPQIIDLIVSLLLLHKHSFWTK